MTWHGGGRGGVALGPGLWFARGRALRERVAGADDDWSPGASPRSEWPGSSRYPGVDRRPNGDSFFEYLLKMYVLWGDLEYWSMFSQTYSSVQVLSGLFCLLGGWGW